MMHYMFLMQDFTLKRFLLSKKILGGKLVVPLFRKTYVPENLPDITLQEMFYYGQHVFDENENGENSS